MAEEDFGQSKTEAPTQRRREEARQQGQVAFSTDLSASLILLTAILVLWWGTRPLAHGLVNSVRVGLLESDCGPELSPEYVQTLFGCFVLRGLDVIGLLLALVFVVSVGVSVLQVGFYFSPQLLAFRWERLSPEEGWSRIFSQASAMRALTALLKVGAMSLLAYWVLHGRAGQIAALSESSLGSAAALGWDIALRLALAIAAALVAVGVLDYIFQRWRLEQQLRMTRQELREELKREEGDPLIRARIRRLQREMAQQRMFREVPRATVVITNPTHLAIALRYDRETMEAPRVVAKGAGFIAKRIAELARRHAVPVLERKPLAQALYKAVNVDQEIPTALYYAVAELLAYVYRLRGVAGERGVLVTGASASAEPPKGVAE